MNTMTITITTMGRCQRPLLLSAATTRQWTWRRRLLVVIAVTWSLVLLLLPVVDALGTGAADCPGGRAAVGGAHLAGDGVTQGSFEQGGISVFMDGQPVGLDGSTNNILNFIVGQPHRITIERPSAYFRGFLFRLGGGIISQPADTITVFSTDTDATTPQVQLAAICVSNYGVGGVTHVDSVEKNSVSFYVTMQDAGSFLPIDITVVQDVTPTSIFYYQSLLANSVAASATAPAPVVPVAVPPPTLAPVPAVPVPAVVPTMPPVAVPVPVPVPPTPSPIQQQLPPSLTTSSPTAPTIPTVWMPPFLRPSTPPAFGPIPPPPTLAPVLVPQETISPVLVPVQKTLSPVLAPSVPGTISTAIPTLAGAAVPTESVPTPVPTKTPTTKDDDAAATRPTAVGGGDEDSTPPVVAPTAGGEATDDAVSILPTRTFYPTVLTFTLSEDYNGIQLVLDNVGSLDGAAQASFNEAMTSWYTDYYAAAAEGEVAGEDEAERQLRRERHGQRLRWLQEDGSLEGFSTTVTYTGESVTASNNTITYDQTVTYSPPSGDDRTGRDLILEPFNRLGSNRDLTALLRESNPAFENLNANGFIKPPTVPEATPRGLPAQGLESGAIIGIAVGSAVFVAMGAYVAYRYIDSRSKKRGITEKERYESGDEDVQPTSPARSVCSPGRASSSGGAPVDEDAVNATLLALQKTRSDEMDDDSLGNSQRRASKELDVSRESSRRGVVVTKHVIGGEDGESIETPLSSSGFGGVLGAAAAALGLSGTSGYTGNGRPANVREEIIYVTAPPGKLGVVIDTPSRDMPPIVHAVKEGSVLENEVLVGDKLLAVDDMDVSAMSAVRVSKLISRKSENATRKLTLMRETIEEDDS